MRGQFQVAPAMIAGDVQHRQAQWQGGNVDSRGLPLSVFGNQWGCCPPLFDRCTDDNIMMLFHGLDTVEAAMRWFGFRKAMHVKEKKAYLTYIAPAGASTGSAVDGLPTTICGPGQRVEMGAPCYIEFCGFGEIRYCSAELKNGGTSTAYCRERDVFTVDFGDGSRRIDNDEEWWMAVLSSQMMESVAQRLYAGDSANLYANTNVPNDSDGLLKLLTAIYPDCPQLNPNVLDWGGNPACDYGSAARLSSPNVSSPTGMSGITLNGNPVTGFKYASNIYVTLRAIYRENVRKMRMTRMLNQRTPQYGDVAILLPDWMIECLIECAICHVVCRDDYTRRDSEMAAMKYEEWLQGGSTGSLTGESAGSVESVWHVAGAVGLVALFAQSATHSGLSTVKEFVMSCGPWITPCCPEVEPCEDCHDHLTLTKVQDIANRTTLGPEGTPAGQVLNVPPPIFARREGFPNQLIPPNILTPIVGLTTVHVDTTGGMMTPAAPTDSIVIPRDGYYHVWGSVATQGLDETDYIQSRLQINGAGTFGAGETTRGLGAGSAFVAPVTHVPWQFFSAGDTVRVLALTNRPGGVMIQGVYVGAQYLEYPVG